MLLFEWIIVHETAVPVQQLTIAMCLAGAIVLQSHAIA